jgi:hypothetical protein
MRELINKENTTHRLCRHWFFVVVGNIVFCRW